MAELIRDELGRIVEAKRVPYPEAAERFLQMHRTVRRDHVEWVLTELAAEERSDLVIPRAVIDGSRYRSSSLSSLVHPPTTECWDRYFDQLTRKDAPGLDELERTTYDVARLLADPHERDARRKGLVMGNVQSGKTRHFAGVVARAMDAGYRFVVVLSGINNNLREQTQSRLDHDLFIDPEAWKPLTFVGDQDFNKDQNLQATFGRKSLLWGCAVVKKNKTRLENLRWSLSQMPIEARRRCPILIIDDEADQATPNSQADKEKISAINKKLREIWNLVSVGSYVAYTATPFANVLMDPDDGEDLFPSDFVYSLEPGTGYFGAERVFGLASTDPDHPGLDEDGLDMVRAVTDADGLKPPSKPDIRAEFDPDLPGSLVDAVEWFIVASAIRRVRGQRDHSSMLVHTTHYTAPHFAMQSRLIDLCAEMDQQVRRGDLTKFKESWEQESERVVSAEVEGVPEWEAVRQQIPGILRDVEVIVDNGRSADRLNYDDDHPRTVIAVGGGTLARGLTLEGLVVSYFTRTSNAYDTLMQMGRWFGYRTGYDDLPRIWLTKGLDQDYAFLARVENDLRDEIRSIRGSEYTPAEVGLKVRTHPGRLEITGAGKMHKAWLVQVGMSGVRLQTFLMDGRPDVTAHNKLAADTLVSGARFEPLRKGMAAMMARGVDNEAVRRFLKSFRYQDDLKTFTREDRAAAMDDWMAKFAAGPTWNVVLMGNPTDGAAEQYGEFDLGGVTVAKLARTPLKTGAEPAKLDFKAVMSPMDRIIDIDPSVYSDQTPDDEGDKILIRRKFGEHKGLLVLYPLSNRAVATDGTPEKQSRRANMPTDAGEDLMAFGIVFPDVDGEGRLDDSFVSVRPLVEPTSSEDEEDVLEGVEE